MSRPISDPRISLNKRGFYEIRWSESGRSKRKSTGLTCHVKAQTMFSQWLYRHASGATNTPIATVKLVCETYLEEVLTLRGNAGDYSYITAYFLECFNDAEISSLTSSHFRQYGASRRAGVIGKKRVTDSSVRRELKFLKSAFSHAVKNKRLCPKDIPHIDLPNESAPRDIWLNEKQRDQLLSFCTGHDLRMGRADRFACIAVLSAARKEAIELLTWDLVDFELGVINYQKLKSNTIKRKVAVPISDRLMPILKRMHAERTTEFVLDHPGSVHGAWAAMQKRLHETTGDTIFLKMTRHCLRHTWATLAARSGVDLWKIAGVLGDSISTIQKTYLHHHPSHLRDAVNA